MGIPKGDVAILRGLAQRVAELAAVPSNQLKIDHWTQVTDLASDFRPTMLVHLWPLAWSEALPDEENLHCVHETARAYERDMRQRIWSVEALRDDTVIEPVIRYPHCTKVIPYPGLARGKRFAEEDCGQTGAAKFEAAIVERSDIGLIGDPLVEVDFEARRRYREEAEAIFDGILDVIPTGVHFAVKVIDEWVEIRGMDRIYLDMMDDPSWMHEALGRIAANFERRFDLCEALGVWGAWDKSLPLGSSGLRFNSDLPNYPDTMARGKCPTADTWQSTMAEGFTCVSPAAHAEFTLPHDMRLLGRFRHINIGCCEVLSHKMEYVRSIPNARRISISEWCDFERAGEEIGTDYVYGYKPAGVPFVGERLRADQVGKELRRVLEAAKGCHTEIILNIGGTLGAGDGAQKLVEWTEIAAAEIDRVHG